LALNPAGKWIPRARVVNLKKKKKIVQATLNRSDTGWKNSRAR